MEIKNFTDTPIRIGEFPHCLDVVNIPNNHSSYGVMAFLHTYQNSEDQHFVQIRKRNDMKGMVLIFYKWIDQINDLPDYIGEVVFDSRNVEY